YGYLQIGNVSVEGAHCIARSLVCHDAVVFQQVQILPKQFAVHLEEMQTDNFVRRMLKLCILK
ncbi:MAG: hypothetical protein ABFS35_01465, partial [Bacteroidota bacterium]